jgi:hypothetical protein
LNGLTTVTYDKALYIRATAAADILVVGRLHTNATISLETGWNLVGYPSFMMSTVGDTLSSIVYQRVEGIGPSGDMEIFDDLSPIATGYGYWVRVGYQQNWTITN